MSNLLKQGWAWVVSVGTGAWGIIEGREALAVVALAVALVTLLERYRAARKHKAEEQLAMAKIDHLRGQSNGKE